MTEVFIDHLTIEGERWDQLAWRYYGDPFAYAGIIRANPNVPIAPVLPGGVLLAIPVAAKTPATPAGLPPWKRGGVDA